jgi:hypothetical protein
MTSWTGTVDFFDQVCMGANFIKLRFVNDDDGTGKLLAQAIAGGFAGEGGAYFSIEEIEQFAKSIATFPLPVDPRPSLAGGFYRKDGSEQLDQEHLGIVVYPIGGRGHIGLQVRIADEVWDHNRKEERRQVQLEIITTYEPLARFSRQIQSVVRGTAVEAALEGEHLP